MKHEVKIGVVCFARKTFDYETALQKYREIQAELKSIENISLVCIPELVIEVEDAQKAASKIASELVDGLICISGTFSLGHLILELNKVVQKPLLLWGLYELPYDGGKIRLNSVCGINLNSSILYKAGVRNFHYVIGDHIDEDWVDALRIVKCFKHAKIGIAGFHAKGFFNLDVDELALSKETGIKVEHYELDEIWRQETTPEQIKERAEQVGDVFNLDLLNEFQKDKVAELTAKLDNFIEKNQIDALAIRCWPEHAANFGISPCAAMSILQSFDNRIIACEGDILGAASMLAHKAIGAETPYFADFSQVDFEEEFALLWHCGVAPCSTWDEKCERSLHTYFAGGKGVTADFVMKPGEISIMRIDSAGQDFRILLQPGRGIPMEKKLRGTYLKAIFDEPIRDVLDKIISNGIAHHTSVVYGDYQKPFEILAKIRGWEVIK